MSTPEEKKAEAWLNVSYGIMWFLVFLGIGACSHLDTSKGPLIHIETSKP